MSFAVSDGRSPWLRYGFSLAATLAATVSRLALDHILGRHSPYLPFVLAVLVAAGAGGRGPGLAATALSMLIVAFTLLKPTDSLAAGDVGGTVGLALFAVVGVVESLLVGRLHEALLSSQDNETRFRNLFQSMDEGFASCELIYDEAGLPVDFRYLEVNPAFETITGLAVAQVRGRRIREVLPGIEPSWMETFDRIVRTGQSARWCAPMAALGRRFELFGWRSGPDRFAFVFSDVTERDRIVEDRNLLASIVESSYDSIVSEDLEGTILSWNPGAERIFGYTSAEMIGQNVSRLTPPDQQAAVAAELERLARGEHIQQHETVLLRKGGHGINVSLTVSPLRNAAGEVIGASNIHRDISARKRAESEIRRLNATLERRVLKRTAQLQEANREMEAFSYSVSHDLRAPLRSVDGFARILLRDYRGAPLDGKAADYLERMGAACRRMGQLIDDLLMLSRVSRQQLGRRRVDLSGMAAGVLSELQSRDPLRAVTVQVQPGLSADADPPLVRLALDNLLGNAWKFTAKASSAEIVFGVDRDLEPPAFFVRDNGAGFDMAHAGQLFLPFQRLHRAEEFEGTGIGLATVQRVIRRHGGQVWADSKPGEGAAFYFTLEDHSEGHDHPAGGG